MNETAFNLRDRHIDRKFNNREDIGKMCLNM